MGHVMRVTAGTRRSAKDGNCTRRRSEHLRAHRVDLEPQMELLRLEAEEDELLPALRERLLRRRRRLAAWKRGGGTGS